MGTSNSGLLLPDETGLDGKPKAQQIKATVIFQDANYTIMRNKDGKDITQEDVLNTPLHLTLIAAGMLDARTYIPQVGKEGFLQTIKRLKKQFDDNYKKQKAIAMNTNGLEANK